MSAPPTIESYHPASVDPTLCIGRRYTDADRRWSPMVYGARQCKALRPSVKDPSAGDLCEKCCIRRDSGNLWDGVVTDMASLPAKSHIAGSAWFLSRKPTWLGTAAPKKAKAVKAVKAVNAVPKEVAPAGDEPIGWLTIIDGEFYWVLKGNVYHYDPIAEVPGDFVGCLRADETIDVYAEEEPLNVVEAAALPLPPVPVIAKEKPKKIPRRVLMSRIAELEQRSAELERRSAELERSLEESTHTIGKLRSSFLHIVNQATENM